MNAAEARALTKQNSYKLANELLKSAIEEMNRQIKQSAKEGKNSAFLRIGITNTWVEENIGDKVMAHFISEGFQAETTQFFILQTIKVSW